MGKDSQLKSSSRSDKPRRDTTKSATSVVTVVARDVVPVTEVEGDLESRRCCVIASGGGGLWIWSALPLGSSGSITITKDDTIVLESLYLSLLRTY